MVYSDRTLLHKVYLSVKQIVLGKKREVGIGKVRFSAILLVFLILVPTVCLPANAANFAQNVAVTKLVDESDYKETLFVITTSDNTYHIIVQASISQVGNETIINLNATLYNPANETITALVRTPDTLTDAPYYNGPVTAFRLHLENWQVIGLDIALVAVMVVAIIFQAYDIIEDYIAHPILQTLETLFFGGPFIYASLPWVMLTLLQDTSPVDGSVNLYFPYLPLSVHVNLILKNQYFVATDFHWWRISEHQVYTDIWTPWGHYRIVWYTYYVAQIYSTRSVHTPLPPTTQFVWNPNQPVAGETVNFTSTSFAQQGATITTYQWKLGDGGQKSTPSFNYTYNNGGVYNVTLQVTDSNGLSGFVSHNLTVQNVVAAALRVVPTDLKVSVQAGKTVNTELLVGETLNQTDLTNVNFRAFDLTNSFDNQTISSGNITFNTNAITVTKGTYTNVTVTFNAPSGSPIGWYSGNLTATSGNGGNATVFADLFVYGPPTANFTWSPLIPKVGDVVTFDGSSSVPGGGSILTYAWNFGDGQTGSGNTTVHTYATAATYTVTLNVTDTNGLWSIKQEQVQVVTVDTSPPTTTLIIGDPKCNTTKKMSVIPSTPFTLNATDPDGKTDVDSTFYKVYNATLQGAFQKYSEPFNLTGNKNGNYTIAYYSVDKAGNIESTKKVNVTLCRAYDNPGDVTGDGKVNIYDITMICMAYDSKLGDPNWNPIVDFCPSDWSHDVINIFDVVTCLQYYGP